MTPDNMNSSVLQNPLPALFFLCLCALPAWAQRPLITEDVEVIRPGAVRLDFGIDFTQNRNFPVSGLNGDLTRVGVVNLRLGMSPNVELESGGVMQNFLSLNNRYRTPATAINLTRDPIS
ncbi:MAG: hypothetical protein ACKV2V_03480, partial [Blastocatellia bacterium]